MDVGDVGGHWEEWWCVNGEQYDGEDGHEVDVVVGHYQCGNCQGYGHFARNCPSTEGKGKGPKGGEKGKGKAKGKGAKGHEWTFKGKGGGKNHAYGYQQYYPKGKSKGKGYQGECWNCGKVGHKANECAAMSTNNVEEGAEETVEIEGMWAVGNVQVETKNVEIQNRFAALAEENEDSEDFEVMPNKTTYEVMPIKTTYAQVVTGKRHGLGKPSAGTKADTVGIAGVNIDEVMVDKTLTRPSTMTFNVAGVCKPLVSAVKVVEAGNRIVMDAEGSYVENKKTGERMQLRSKKGVFVFDVKYQDGDTGEITLDSGAGVSVWPKGHKQELIRVGPKKEGLKLVAANGTIIENVGQTRVVFRGVAPAAPFSGQP